MAKLPTLKRILRADLGPEVPKWLEPLLLTLNNFMQNVWAQLNQSLTFGENFDAKILQVEIHGESPMTSFICPFNRPMKGLIVLQTSGTDLVTGVVGTNWRQVGQTVELIEVFGLPPTGIFTLVLLAI